MALASWPSTSRCRGDKDSFTPRSDPRAHGTPAHTCSGRHNTEDAALLFTGHHNRTTGLAPLPAPAHSIHLPVLMSYGSLASELSESTLNKTRPEGDDRSPVSQFQKSKNLNLRGRSRHEPRRHERRSLPFAFVQVSAGFRLRGGTRGVHAGREGTATGRTRWLRRHCNGARPRSVICVVAGTKTSPCALLHRLACLHSRVFCSEGAQ